MDTVLRINELLAKGETFCLATVISSADRQIAPGLKVIIHPDGLREGGTGQDETDKLLSDLALQVLSEQKKKLIEVGKSLTVFFDIMSAKARIVICGAGHIAIPLARYAKEVGFAVTVLDDRPDFASPDRFPGCEVIADDFVRALGRIPTARSTFVVIITRGHEHDVECLTEIIKHETAYIGLIGSRRRVGFVLEMLAEQGIAKERLADIFTPIGVPIGAESPEEIALSITAELVCVRRKGMGQAKALSNAVRGSA